MKLDFEYLFRKALIEVIDNFAGGSLEGALDDVGICDTEQRKAIKEWLGWNDCEDCEDEDDLGFDRRQIEKDYHLGEGSLDGIDNLKYIAGIIGCEDGELDRYLWDDDNECYFYEEEEG